MKDSLQRSLKRLSQSLAEGKGQGFIFSNLLRSLHHPVPQEEDLGSECSEEGKGARSIRSSLSLEIHGLQRERHVYFSNQEYYRRLEELKSNHLRNMAELERMYVSQERDEDQQSVG